MPRVDPHSYFDSDQPRTRHLDLDLAVDFDRQRVAGQVTLVLEKPSSGPLDLDTKGLVIASVRTDGGRPISYDTFPEEPILGSRMRLTLPAGTAQVVIAYETGPDAIGLQWLAPEQTAGRRHPFMFTQFQPIHARTMVPCQDSPAARVTYDAAITVPEALAAVMSAGPLGDPVGSEAGMRTLRFAMPQAIPALWRRMNIGRSWQQPASRASMSNPPGSFAPRMRCRFCWIKA